MASYDLRFEGLGAGDEMFAYIVSSQTITLFSFITQKAGLLLPSCDKNLNISLDFLNSVCYGDLYSFTKLNNNFCKPNFILPIIDIECTLGLA
jgi:hypothetical protein